MDDNQTANLEQIGPASLPRVFGHLAGKTDALNLAHLDARDALLRRLKQHHPWLKLRADLANRAGYHAAVTRCRENFLTVARTLNFESVVDLKNALATCGDSLSITVDLNETVDPRTATEMVHANLDAALTRLEASADTFLALLESSEATTAVVTGIVDFVRDELKLPWAWVAIDLVESFYYGLVGFATHEVYSLQRHYVREEDRISTPLRFELEVGAGRLIDEALASITEHLRQVRAAARGLQAAPQGIPVGRPRDAEVTARYVDWFFRHHVLRESIRSIARQPVENGISRGAKDIRTGIREAKALLSISPQFWTDVSEQDIAEMSRFWATLGSRSPGGDSVNYERL